MSASPRLEPDERAGCLKAWLIVLLVTLGLGSFFYFYSGIVLGSQVSQEAGLMSLLLSVAFSIGAAGAATLLARRRLGLFMLVGAFLFAGFLQLLAAFRIEIALAGALNLALIWWLVRPAWNRLE